MDPNVLLAGSIGALFVFFLGVFREFRRRRQELRGIARLIHSEIKLNHLPLQTFYDDPERVFSPLLASIRTETWEDVNVRLAAMMPADDFGDIVYFYMYMHDLKHMPAGTHGHPAHLAVKHAKKSLSIISEQERDATAVARHTRIWDRCSDGGVCAGNFQNTVAKAPVRWKATLTDISGGEGGYEELGFKNQGQCIKAVNDKN